MKLIRIVGRICFVLALALAFYGGAITTGYAKQNEAKPAASALLNLNQATAEELIALKGIGPKMAERIIAYRQENGPFKTVDQLVQVKGIGDAKFQKLKDQVTV